VFNLRFGFDGYTLISSTRTDPFLLFLLADYIAYDPTYGCTGRCSNSRASANDCAKYRPAGSTNACATQSRLLCSGHSRTPDERKNKNKHNKNNRDAFHLMAPF
jgi:hypothetical protein